MTEINLYNTNYLQKHHSAISSEFINLKKKT